MSAWLTTEDEQAYGADLLNLSQRAALHALSPELQEIRQQNAELQRRVAQEARHRLDSQVAAAVPNYREIDRNPYWHRYLLELDVYSGRPRQQLLNDAIASGDANRVTAFFRGFERESGATQVQSPSAPSGRNRAAPSGRIYSRDEIARLYEAHRKCAYVGRESEWQRQEADIFAAQRENRIQGVYLTK